jgi:hypothetical protein
MTHWRTQLAERLQRIRDDWSTGREGLAENRRQAQEPISILYVRCDGCGDVTAHMSTQRVGTITWTGSVVAPPEVVCDICRHAQPRVRGDEVESDQELVCAAFRYQRWRGRRSRRHRCGRIFMAPHAARRPRCQWCLGVQPES